MLSLTTCLEVRSARGPRRSRNFREQVVHTHVGHEGQSRGFVEAIISAETFCLGNLVFALLVQGDALSTCAGRDCRFSAILKASEATSICEDVSSVARRERGVSGSILCTHGGCPSLLLSVFHYSRSRNRSRMELSSWRIAPMLVPIWSKETCQSLLVVLDVQVFYPWLC